MPSHDPDPFAYLRRRAVRRGGLFTAPYEFNFKASQFVGARQALLNVKNGVQREIFLAVGESTIEGESAGDTDGANNRKNQAVYRATSIVAGILANAGYPTNTTSFFGSGSLAGVNLITNWRAGTVQIMPGVDFATAWVLNGAGTVGGTLFSSGGSGTASFNPQTVSAVPIPVDTFRLFDITASGAGTGTYNVDGGVSTPVTQTSATESYRSTIIPAGSLGSHTLNLTRSTGTFFVAGVHAYNSAAKELDFFNVGVGSAKISDLLIATTQYGRLPALLQVAAGAKIVFIKIQINDSAAGTPEATFKANYQSLIDAIKSVAAPNVTIVLNTSQPSRIDIIPDATQQLYRQYVKDVALANDLPCIDQYAIFTNWVAMNANGYAFNANHMNKAGNDAEGSLQAISLLKWCGF